MKNSGFTLIELCIVIAILGMLGSIFYPMYLGFSAAEQAVVSARYARAETDEFLRTIGRVSPHALVPGDTLIFNDARSEVRTANTGSLPAHDDCPGGRREKCEIRIDAALEVVGKSGGRTLLRVYPAAATFAHCKMVGDRACGPGTLFYVSDDVAERVAKYTIQRKTVLLAPTPESEQQTTERLLREYDAQKR